MRRAVKFGERGAPWVQGGGLPSDILPVETSASNSRTLSTARWIHAVRGTQSERRLAGHSSLYGAMAPILRSGAARRAADGKCRSRCAGCARRRSCKSKPSVLVGAAEPACTAVTFIWVWVLAWRGVVARRLSSMTFRRPHLQHARARHESAAATRLHGQGREAQLQPSC